MKKFPLSESSAKSMNACPSAKFKQIGVRTTMCDSSVWSWQAVEQWNVLLSVHTLGCHI
jgi:hypothetical protein